MFERCVAQVPIVQGPVPKPKGSSFLASMDKNNPILFGCSLINLMISLGYNLASRVWTDYLKYNGLSLSRLRMNLFSGELNLTTSSPPPMYAVLLGLGALGKRPFC